MLNAVLKGMKNTKTENEVKMDYLKKEFSSSAWCKTYNHLNMLNTTYGKRLFAIILRRKLREIVKIKESII